MVGFGFPPPVKKHPFAIDWDEVYRLEEEERKRKEELKKLFARPSPYDGAAELGMHLLGRAPKFAADSGMEPLRPDDPSLAQAALAAADPAKARKLLGENPSPVREALVAAAALHDQNRAEPYFGLQKVAAPKDQPRNQPAPFDWPVLTGTPRRVSAPDMIVPTVTMGQAPQTPAPQTRQIPMPPAPPAPLPSNKSMIEWARRVFNGEDPWANAGELTPGGQQQDDYLARKWMYESAQGHRSSLPPAPPPEPWREAWLKDPTWLQAGPEPTMRDRFASWMLGENPSFEHEKFVERTMGTRGLGETGFGAVDLTPLGLWFDYQEALQQGRTQDAMIAILPGAKVVKKGGREAKKLLGEFVTTTPESIVDVTKARGGYTVNLATGERPTQGLIVGKYPADNPRNTVIEGLPTAADIEAHVAKNARALGRPDNYLRIWQDPASGKTHLEVVQLFPEDDIRRAAKTGERRGQTSGVNLATGKSFQIGNWDEFIASPEFYGRLDELAQEGAKHLSKFEIDELLKTYGTSFERVYGKENMPQVIGFLAATTQASRPRSGIQAMTEYMRRHIKGEPTVQPEFRAPETAMGGLVGPGKEMPLEANRARNLEIATSGDYRNLRRDKIRNIGGGMAGDPDAATFDRHIARVAEDPSRGIFTDTVEGMIPHRAGSDRPYMRLYNQFIVAAERSDEPVNSYAAKVWVGIRERIRKEGEAFGQKYTPGAVRGETKPVAEDFNDLIFKKAAHLKISALELERRLRDGDAELLSFVLAAPLGAALLEGAVEGPHAAGGEGGGS